MEDNYVEYKKIATESQEFRHANRISIFELTKLLIEWDTVIKMFKDR